MFKRIDHIELLTAHLESVVTFYTEILGFSERERETIPNSSHGPLELVYLELGGTFVEVLCYPELQSIAPRNSTLNLGWQCLALEVEEMDGAIRLLKSKGVDIVWGPVKLPDYTRAEIRDPDGNPIELRQWHR